MVLLHFFLSIFLLLLGEVYDTLYCTLLYYDKILPTGTYSHLRNTGFLQLPHRTTLNQYTNFTDIGTGYNVDVIKRLHEDFNLDKVDDKHRICSLLIDEMKIKSGLLYSRHTGNLTLFLNVILYFIYFIFLTTVDFLHVLNYF